MGFFGVLDIGKSNRIFLKRGWKDSPHFWKGKNSIKLCLLGATASSE